MGKPKFIAFYLPQYHPTPDNDKWWGKGFTEWTNVGKAKPLFRGHYQPKVPADLGYYDLRLPQVREEQARLAKEAGIYGFCYYHYWFGNGKEELELPFNEVLASGKPDFPFMLCRANESWHRKFWNKDGKGISKEVLVEQNYPGDKDVEDHFYRLLPAFKDRRYILINNSPAFMVYKPFSIENTTSFIRKWRKLARENGISDICFIAYLDMSITAENIDKLFSMGYDRVVLMRLWQVTAEKRNVFSKAKQYIANRLFGKPKSLSFNKVYTQLVREREAEEKIYPTIIPNWDHSPRSNQNSFILLDTNPQLFGKHIEDAISKTCHKKENLIFIKSWNEWGEGNYLEPDLKFGKGFLDIISTTLEKFNK